MSASPIRILVVEDDKALSEVLCEELQARGHRPVPAESVEAALNELNLTEFDVCLLDLMLPDGSGIEVLKRIVSEDLPSEAIVLTGYAAVSTAIEAMKLGAYDYVSKPARMEELEVLVLKAAEKSRLRRENASLHRRLQHQDNVQGLITEDPAMKALLATLDRVAASELPVLVQGESGTGKELFARAVHQRSPRAGGPFVALNCGAVPESLLESEIFGHEKGAFTGAIMRKPGLFEAADRGVLFLDEVGEVSTSLQVKLLRVIETKEFLRVGATRPARADVRIVSATNKNLKTEVDGGRFRGDLYYRLNGITLSIPPLRDRRDDIALLAMHFIQGSGAKKKLSPRAIETLRLYAWPGNVRELQMVIQRAVILSDGETIDAEDLPLEAGAPGDWKTAAIRTGLTLADLETEYIQTILKENDGHRGRTARALGINAKTLYNKLGPERPREK